jgi:hypothetical protein
MKNVEITGARMHGRNEKFHHFSLEMEILLRTRRWEGNIKIDIREIWCENMDLINLDQVRDQRWDFVNTIMNYQVLHRR